MGSEMCIRDRCNAPCGRHPVPAWQFGGPGSPFHQVPEPASAHYSDGELRDRTARAGSVALELEQQGATSEAQRNQHPKQGSSAKDLRGHGRATSGSQLIQPRQQRTPQAMAHRFETAQPQCHWPVRASRPAANGPADPSTLAARPEVGAPDRPNRWLLLASRHQPEAVAASAWMLSQQRRARLFQLQKPV